jgi:Cu+-exporting ATPase
MSAGDIIVVIAAAVALAGLGWFFFGPRKARTAELAGGVQRATVTVRGGYSPEVLRVRRGLPVELVFDRQESGDCTSRVVFPDFQVSAALPAYQQTTVRLDPSEAGQFGFACGMNMIHGTLIVEPATGGATVNGAAPGGVSQAAASPGAAASCGPASVCGAVPAAAGEAAPGTQQAQDAEAAERQAEIRDLARRVIVGAVLTLPVLYAAMAHDVFGLWVPGLLLNHWVQLALITPVMFYTGWPIHRTGWLALSHRSADMNSLITIGTCAAYGYSLVVTLAPSLLPPEVRGVYFETTGVILTLILLGRLIETRAKAGTGRPSGNCSACRPAPPG